MKKKDKIQDEVDDEHEGIMHEINNFVGLESAEPQILEVAISKKTKDSTHTNPTESKKKKKHKESEKTKVSLEPTKETEVANEPVQTAPVAIDSHTVTSLTSENQEPPQEITTFTKKKKKEKDETKSEMKKLLQKVEQVEEKLKQREQITVTVCNVTVSKLVRVHKLIRNHPWLKVTYGSSHEWVAEYITPEEEEEESDDVNNNPTDVAAKKKQRKEGSMAEWRGLSWSFTLERNESDRSDLVFAVCSKDLVIGRYTVKREEFKDIPDSNSGYFSISGDVTNTLGKVGVIQLICQRAVAQRPLSPVQAKRKATKRLEAEISKEGVVEEKKGGGEEGKEAEEEVMVADDPPKRHLDTWRYQHVSLRVLSVAVMDLKSAHFLEANSPSVVMESGEWMGMTEPLKNAGMAASWQKLQWKIAVDRDSGVSIFVNSHAKMIGKLFLSAEELLTIQPEESRKVLALVKYISHGSDITGKMKLHVIINHPDDIVESPVLNSVMVDGVEKEEVLTGVNVERQFRTVPFNVIIQEIVCLDISFPLMNRLFQRSASVKLQCACNAWTSTTDEIEAKGENAHWINLRWKMPVTTTQTALRSTLWYNKGQGQLGKSLISVTDLQQIPCDRTGRAEIFSKLVNEKGEIVSKLRLTCRFEENLIALQKLAEGSTKSQWESHDDTSLPMNHSMSFDEAVITHSQYSHHSRSRPHSASSPTPPRPFSLDTSLPVPTRLHFPLAGMIQSISVIDLPSVHTLRKNSPQVEFVYDRASIATEVCVNGGAMARWEELLWAIRIRADSRLRFVVKSNQTVIGTAQIDPRQMILLPVNPDGCIEIVSDLFSANKSSGIAVGKVVVSYQVDLESQRRNQFNDVLGVPASPTSALTPVKGGAGTSFDEYSSKHSLANDSMPLPRPASPPLDFSQQQFQPTIVFDPNVLYAAESEKHYSFRISISEIDLWDLKPFHSLSKNCPQLFAVCGRWSGNSTVQTNVSDQCYWSDLQWSFYVVDRTTRLRVRVTSRGKEVGTVFFSLAQLTEAPTDEDLTKRISVPIMSDAQGEIGKMKMTYVMEAMKRNPKSPKPEHIIRDESTSGPSIAYPPTPLMHSAAPPSSSSSSWIVFPCTITLLEVKAFDVLLTSLGGSHEPFGAESVKRAMQLSATSVSFRLHCDDFYQSIEGQVQPNGLIVLRQLSWAIPLQKEDSLITFVILRRGEEVAHVRATAKSLLRDSTIISSEGLRERVLRLQSILNADIGEGGNLHLIFHATNQLPYHPNTTSNTPYNTTYNTPSHTLPPLLPHGRNPMTSYSPLASPTHHNQHNLEGSVSLPSLFPIHQNLTQPLDVNHSINASQLTLENSVSYQNDTFEGAVRFSIVAIAAVDLPAAHRLKPNSPVCSVACGKFTATTQVSSNSGDTAIWENLKMTFDCKRTSRVRFVVTSGDQLIGSCHFSRGRMLFNGTPAPNGSHVIFGDITNNSGKEVGRIKLMYEVTMPESVTNQ